jgi:glycosidase
MRSCFNIVMWVLLLTFAGCKEEQTIDISEGVTIEPFDNIPAIEDMVVYEVNMRAFSTEGGLNGVAERIDYLKSLGVNVIWLMPLYPIGQENSVNSPYCIRDFEDVNIEFGSFDDLKRLVNAAHAEDMAVILDWVANHTAWDHPWIDEHPEWYSQDGQGNIISPPNTGWNDVADLNYDNSAMRQEMVSSMQFWIDNAGIDGFRFDAVDYVPSDFWEYANSSLKSGTTKDVILLAEGGDKENIASGFEMNYAFDFHYAMRPVFANGASANRIIETHEYEYEGLGDGWKLRYTTNHDVYAHEGTLFDFYTNEQGILAAFAIELYLKGVPLIYTGQEIAHPSTISFFDYNPLSWEGKEELIAEHAELIGIRQNNEAFKTGDYQAYPNDDVVMFERSNADAEFLVLVNIRNSNSVVSLPEVFQNSDWTNIRTEGNLRLESEVTLEPYQFLLLKKS